MVRSERLIWKGRRAASVEEVHSQYGEWYDT